MSFLFYNHVGLFRVFGFNNIFYDNLFSPELAFVHKFNERCIISLSHSLLTPPFSRLLE